MRLLALADLHGDHDIYRWLVEIAAEVRSDIVVLAGDLLGYPDGYATVEEAQRADAAKICEILENIGQPVIYVMGNDDMIELEPNVPGIRSIHEKRVELSDINFVGYQYSLPFMAGIYEKPEEEIRKDLSAIGSLVDQNTVFVTHSPAFGVLDVSMLDNHVGSIAIKDLIEDREPLLHIHGHIHRAFGRDGRHFNVAAAWRSRAVLIDTTTMDHVVKSKEAV